MLVYFGILAGNNLQTDMNFDSRLELHRLVFSIVSLRLVMGNYEDSATCRGKLEIETRARIARMAELDNKTELEAAQSLHDQYSENVRDSMRSRSLAPQSHKRLRPAV
jgi:hypothetical protein